MLKGVGHGGSCAARFAPVHRAARTAAALSPGKDGGGREQHPLMFLSHLLRKGQAVGVLMFAFLAAGAQLVGSRQAEQRDSSASRPPELDSSAPPASPDAAVSIDAPPASPDAAVSVNDAFVAEAFPAAAALAPEQAADASGATAEAAASVPPTQASPQEARDVTGNGSTSPVTSSADTAPLGQLLVMDRPSGGGGARSAAAFSSPPDSWQPAASDERLDIESASLRTAMATEAAADDTLDLAASAVVAGAPGAREERLPVADLSPEVDSEGLPALLPEPALDAVAALPATSVAAAPAPSPAVTEQTAAALPPSNGAVPLTDSGASSEDAVLTAVSEEFDEPRQDAAADAVAFAVETDEVDEARQDAPADGAAHELNAEEVDEAQQDEAIDAAAPDAQTDEADETQQDAAVSAAAPDAQTDEADDVFQEVDAVLDPAVFEEEAYEESLDVAVAASDAGTAEGDEAQQATKDAASPRAVEVGPSPGSAVDADEAAAVDADDDALYMLEQPGKAAEASLWPYRNSMPIRLTLPLSWEAGPYDDFEATLRAPVMQASAREFGVPDGDELAAIVENSEAAEAEVQPVEAEDPAPRRTTFGDRLGISFWDDDEFQRAVSAEEPPAQGLLAAGALPLSDDSGDESESSTGDDVNATAEERQLATAGAGRMVVVAAGEGANAAVTQPGGPGGSGAGGSGGGGGDGGGGGRGRGGGDGKPDPSGSGDGPQPWLPLLLSMCAAAAIVAAVWRLAGGGREPGSSGGGALRTLEDVGRSISRGLGGPRSRGDAAAVAAATSSPGKPAAVFPSAEAELAAFKKVQAQAEQAERHVRMAEAEAAAAAAAARKKQSAHDQAGIAAKTERALGQRAMDERAEHSRASQRDVASAESPRKRGGRWPWSRKPDSDAPDGGPRNGASFAKMLPWSPGTVGDGGGEPAATGAGVRLPPSRGNRAREASGRMRMTKEEADALADNSLAWIALFAAVGAAGLGGAWYRRQKRSHDKPAAWSNLSLPVQPPPAEDAQIVAPSEEDVPRQRSVGGDGSFGRRAFDVAAYQQDLERMAAREAELQQMKAEIEQMRDDLQVKAELEEELSLAKLENDRLRTQNQAQQIAMTSTQNVLIDRSEAAARERASFTSQDGLQAVELANENRRLQEEKEDLAERLRQLEEQNATLQKQQTEARERVARVQETNKNLAAFFKSAPQSSPSVSGARLSSS